MNSLDENNSGKLLYFSLSELNHWIFLWQLPDTPEHYDHAQQNLIAYFPTVEELHQFSDTFASHCARETIQFWSMIDVKKHQTCPQMYHKRVLYSGHHGFHYLKHLTLEAPNIAALGMMVIMGLELFYEKTVEVLSIFGS
jgi:hypothetical protein